MSRPDGIGKQPCVHCPRKSVPGLERGQGLCPYHWAVAQWGKAWADTAYPPDSEAEALVRIEAQQVDNKAPGARIDNTEENS